MTDTRRLEFGHTRRHAVDALADKHPHRRPISGDDGGDPLFSILGDRYSPIYEYDRKVGHFLTESSASYQFPSRRHWAQAKEVRVVSPPVVADLFAEQDLPTPPDWLRDEAIRVRPAPGSPSLQGRDLTPREREILDSVAGRGKYIRLPPDAAGGNDCAMFREWLVELMTLETLPETQLDAALAALPEIPRPQDASARKLATKVWSILGEFFEKTPLPSRSQDPLQNARRVANDEKM